MFVEIFNTVFYNPIYNLLVFLVDTVSLGDVGIAIILTTLLIKIILIPVSLSALKTQRAMKELQPKLKELQKTLKDNREEQARQMLALYKKYDVKPFSSVLIFLIQIPIVFALYFVFLNEPFPKVNMELLYPFIIAPSHISLDFLGFFDVTQKSIILALIAGVTQYFSIQFLLGRKKKEEKEEKKESKEPSFKDEFMKNMEVQMKYGMPVLIAIVAYVVSSAVALYLITSNLFALLQELFLNKKQTSRSDPQQPS
jgi:YidC/Oxa1 family membrane protein insertase